MDAENSDKQRSTVEPRETPDVAQNDGRQSEMSVTVPDDDGQQMQHADFLEYLNERFCGFTGS